MDTTPTIGSEASYQARVVDHFLYVAGDDTTDLPERRDFIPDQAGIHEDLFTLVSPAPSSNPIPHGKRDGGSL